MRPVPLVVSSSWGLDRVALALALLPALVVPTMLGGVHPTVAVGACVVELAALACWIVDRRRKGAAPTVSWLGLPLLLATASAALATTPLPMGMLRLLAPTAAQRIDAARAILPADGAALVASVWSLDPPDTRAAVVRLVAALCCFLVVADRSRKREHRRFVARAALAGSFATFAIVAGRFVTDDRVGYGTFAASDLPLLALPVNPNHAARVFGVLALICFGRAVFTRNRVEALWYAVGGIGAGAGVFLSPSRGAMVAFVAAALLLVALAAVKRTDDDVAAGGIPLLPTVLLVLAVAAGVFLAHESVTRELGSLDRAGIASSKVFLYAPALRVIEATWPTGVGAGAFGVALPALLRPGELDAETTYTHVENLPLDVLAAHGAVVGGAVLVGAAILLLASLAGMRSREHLAALPALAFLGLGELFDFFLDLPAGALLGAVVLGVVAGAAGEAGVLRRAVRGSVAVGTAAVLVLVAAVAAVGAVDGWRPALDERLRGTKGQARRAGLERAFALHPSDAQYAYELAVDARRRRDPAAALALANRALALWPSHKGAHVEAARALAAAGRFDQALVEYRVAWRVGGPDRRLLLEVARRTASVDARRSILPAGDPVALEMLCRVLGEERRTLEAEACLVEAAALPDARDDVRVRAVDAALARGDAAAADERLRAFSDDAPLDGELAVLAARVDALRTSPHDALQRAAGRLPFMKRRGPLQEWRLRTAMELGELVVAKAIIDDVRRGNPDRATLDRLDRAEAAVYERANDLPTALQAWRRIAARAPKDVAALVAQARIELALSLLDAAKQTYGKAARLAPNDPAVRALGDDVLKRDAAAREERFRGTKRTAP